VARKRISDGIDTGHKAFDRQANATVVTVGNVMSDVQFSSYVRPADELECNGFTNEPGHLQNFDIQQFRRSRPEMPAHVERAARAAADRWGGAILYRFGYWVRVTVDPRRIHMGWVVTDKQHRLVAAFPASTPKARRVIDTLLNFVTEGESVPALDKETISL
jgi:hypothetical protein